MFDPDDRDAGILPVEIRVGIQPGFAAHADRGRVQRPVRVAFYHPLEPGALPVEPVAHDLPGAPSASGAAVSMDDFQDSVGGGAANRCEGFLQLPFHVGCPSRRMSHIDDEQWAGGWRHGLNLLRRSEFPRTLTELKAMAAAAIMGFSSPSAASGIPTLL